MLYDLPNGNAITPVQVRMIRVMDEKVFVHGEIAGREWVEEVDCGGTGAALAYKRRLMDDMAAHAFPGVEDEENMKLITDYRDLTQQLMGWPWFVAVTIYAERGKDYVLTVWTNGNSRPEAIPTEWRGWKVDWQQAPEDMTR